MAALARRTALCAALPALALATFLLAGAAPLAGEQVAVQPRATTWAWSLANPAGFGPCDDLIGCDNVRVRSLASFGAHLFAGTTNAASGAEIWSFDGLSWQRQVSGGLGDPLNTEVTSMAVFSGKLYAGTQQSESSGAELWSFNGAGWTRVLSGGFDGTALPSDPKNIAATALAPLGERLYIGTRFEYRGAEIWAYDGITVTQIVSRGLANLANAGVLSMATFDGRLFAGTLNSNGAEMWASSNGLQWTRVVTRGFGIPANIGISALVVLSNTLYAATENSATGAEVWRSTDGVVWQHILNGGFGDPGLSRINALLGHQGWLYAAVGHGSALAGAVWAFDGQVWQQAAASGLLHEGQGRSFYEARSMAAFAGKIYVGTSQAYSGGSVVGPDIWSSQGPSVPVPSPSPSRTPTPLSTATLTRTPLSTSTATTTRPPASATPSATATLAPPATPTATATRTETNVVRRLYLPVVSGP